MTNRSNVSFNILLLISWVATMVGIVAISSSQSFHGIVKLLICFTYGWFSTNCMFIYLADIEYKARNVYNWEEPRIRFAQVVGATFGQFVFYLIFYLAFSVSVIGAFVAVAILQKYVRIEVRKRIRRGF